MQTEEQDNNQEKQVKCFTYLHPELKRKFKQLTAEQGETPSSAMRDMIVSYCGDLL